MPQGHSPVITRAAIAYAVIAALVLLFLGRLAEPVKFFKATSPATILTGADPGAGILYGVLAGALLILSGEAAIRFTRWGRSLQKLLGRMFGAPHPADAIILAVLSAFAEELLFRGVILPYMGLVGSAALFGLAHLVPRRDLWPWSAWACAAGILFGWLAIETGGILAPATAHFAVNAAGLLRISASRGK